MVLKGFDRTYDTSLVLSDGAAAVTADGYTQVSSATATLDLGDGLFEGDLVIDVSAIDVSSTDETYVLRLVGATASAFSTIASIASLELGRSAVLGPATVNKTTGRYVLPFRNVGATTAGADPVTLRYIRLYADVGGTTPSITATAYVGKLESSC